MQYSDFQKLVCTSAQQYYDFLSERFERGIISSGHSSIQVYKVTPTDIPGEYTFFLCDKLKHPGSHEIWIRGKKCDGLSIISGSMRSVRVLDNLGIIENTHNLLPEEIHLVSDLTFLVRDLKNFYAQNSFSFFPQAPSGIPELPRELMDGLSDEQHSAIDTVFSSPISYISGAPGTGKTKAVLSRCILRYMLSGKRVFLLAPTNNAVEQMLRGILPILVDSGIDLKKVYRLGTSTEEFAKEYPEVIGDHDTDTLMHDLMSQRQHYVNKLTNYNNCQQAIETAAKQLDNCRSVHEAIVPVLSLLQEKRSSISAVSEELHNATDDSYRKAAQYSQAEQKQKETLDLVVACESTIQITQNQLNKIRHFFWKKKERTRLSDTLTHLLISLPHYRESLNDAREFCHVAAAASSESQHNCDVLESELSQLQTEYETIKKNAIALSEQDSEYANALLSTLNCNNFSPTVLAALIQARENTYQQLVGTQDDVTPEAFQEQIDRIDQQIRTLSSSAKVHQKYDALVLAGTIESALPELAIASNPKHPEHRDFSHAFLDEAGYTSLSRGMSAFAANAPVTFLGDHKQLPPICEMNDIKPECMPIILWALPVAYFSELMQNNLLDIYHHCYQHSDEPSFNLFAYCSLNTSYRFGTMLAEVLGKYIYTTQFRGAASTPFEILVIDAPRSAGDIGRISRSECAAIRKYLSHHIGSDIAILAPYRQQIKQLHNALPVGYRDNILTVHRSQGCEWSTVVFSVTDSQRPFFTNSKLSIGRSIINTAISRSKKRLVIVCDTNSWLAQQNQLISELIKIGQPIITDPTLQ